MAAYVPNVAGMVLASEDGNAETIPRQWVGSGIFDVLGVRPIASRHSRECADDARRSKRLRQRSGDGDNGDNSRTGARLAVSGLTRLSPI